MSSSVPYRKWEGEAAFYPSLRRNTRPLITVRGLSTLIPVVVSCFRRFLVCNAAWPSLLDLNLVPELVPFSFDKSRYFSEQR